MEDSKKLVHLIEKHPEIYHTVHRAKADRETLRRIWQKIANEMDSNPVDCKRSWSTLRCSYARIVKTEKQRASVGAKKPTKRRRWYLMEAMSFLKDHILNNTMSKRHPLSMVIDEDEVEVDESATSIPISSSESEDSGEEGTEKNSLNEITPMLQTSAQVPQRHSAPDETHTILCEPIVEYAKAVYAPNNSEDPNMTFFRSVLPDLNKLSERKQRQVKQDFLINLNKQLDDQEKASNGIPKYLNST